MCDITPSHRTCPRLAEIGLTVITTAKISNKFSRESPYFKNNFSRESPQFQTIFRWGKRESPSPKRVDRKTVQFGNLNIFGLISSVCGCVGQGDHHSRFMCRYIYVTTLWNVWHDFFTWDIQPIPREMTFSKALSKLKAQSSNVSFPWNVAKETFELWALSFEIAFENVTPSGIGCTLVGAMGSSFEFGDS